MFTIHQKEQKTGKKMNRIRSNWQYSQQHKSFNELSFLNPNKSVISSYKNKICVATQRFSLALYKSLACYKINSSCNKVCKPKTVHQLMSLSVLVQYNWIIPVVPLQKDLITDPPLRWVKPEKCEPTIVKKKNNFNSSGVLQIGSNL